MVRKVRLSAQEKWLTAYRKALRHFGHRAQAARIAWGAVDIAAPKFVAKNTGRKPGKRVSVAKRGIKKRRSAG